MFDDDLLIALAEQSGFTHCATLDVAGLEFMPEVRDMCNAKQCDKYDTSWSCPPACATLEEMRLLALSFAGGLLVQTVGEIEDSCDWDGIMKAGACHKENFGRMWDALESANMPVLAMGAGACNLCSRCTYPDAPCRFPDRLSASMEACGLLVSKVCTDNGLAYNYGQGKIAFTSCFLVN